MLRFIIAVLFVVLFLICSIPIMLVEWLIGKHNQHAKDISSLRIVQWAFRVLLWISGVKRTVIGLENIPADSSALFVLNHCSMFDIPLTYTLMSRPTGFVAKKELESWPLLRNWMHNLYCLFLDRKNPKASLKCILTAIDYMKNGVSILICPEGTRSKDGTMLPFKEGSFKIAIKSKRPIIPIALTYTSPTFEDHFPKIQPLHVVLEFGKPIDPTTMDKDELTTIGATTQKIIQDMLDRNEDKYGIK